MEKYLQGPVAREHDYDGKHDGKHDEKHDEKHDRPGGHGFWKQINVNARSCICGKTVEPPSDYVIGGAKADIYKYPWFVKMIITHDDGNTFICGGSIISDKHIITAAHCFMEFKSINVYDILGKEIGT